MSRKNLNPVKYSRKQKIELSKQHAKAEFRGGVFFVALAVILLLIVIFKVF